MSEHKHLTLDDLAQMAATGHSVFSPSGSKMWLTCSGSLIPNILAEDTAGEEAAEGTIAHAVSERWLKAGERPDHLIGTFEEENGFEIEITDEMMAYCGDYVDYVQAVEDEAVEFLTETRVDFSNLTPIPKQGGTADHIAILEIEQAPGEYEICVTDLKYGKGVRVVAEGNTQGRIYGYGAYRIFRSKYNITRIRIRICHPRLVGGVTEFTYTIDELLDFARYVKQRAHDAWQFNAPRTPSDEGCQWCKVKGTCAAAYEHLAEVTSGVFDDDPDEDAEYPEEVQRSAIARLEDDLGPAAFKPIDPPKLSTAALAKILRYRKLMEQFFSAVEKELLNRAISDEEDIPGWKLVEGRTNRKWPDSEAQVYLLLKKAGLKDTAIYDQSIISPAQAETKLHAKAGLSKEDSTKVVARLAFKPRGPKSLVRRTDNREALPSDASVFDDDDPID